MTEPGMNEKIANEIIDKIYDSHNMNCCGGDYCDYKSPFNNLPSTAAQGKAEANEIKKIIIKALNDKDLEIARLSAQVKELESEIKDFRNIDRQKDKDWGKWYGFYHEKVDRVAELEAEVKRLQELLDKQRLIEHKNWAQYQFDIKEYKTLLDAVRRILNPALKRAKVLLLSASGSGITESFLFDDISKALSLLTKEPKV